MGYEIEFFPVGEGSKAGDAICVRYGEPDNYRVLVIDGGTDASGEALVRHIQNVYGYDTIVSDVISSHPDSDHSSGLRNVLRELPVERLWIHGLWDHADHIRPYFTDDRLTVDSLARRIRSEYPIISELRELANQEAVVVLEPFAGAQIGPFTVMSPTLEAYRYLLPQFRRTPEADVGLLQALGVWLGDVQKQSIFSNVRAQIEEGIARFIPERWDVELLREGGATAAENESSVVLLGEFYGELILLTADAGVQSLTWVCDLAEGSGVDLSACKLVQVPHHGSRRNVAPSVLNRLVGPPQPFGSAPHKMAVASVPVDSSKHPRKVVINAFTRRGVEVARTQGARFRWHLNMPQRFDEGPAPLYPFFDAVEDYD